MLTLASNTSRVDPLHTFQKNRELLRSVLGQSDESKSLAPNGQRRCRSENALEQKIEIMDRGTVRYYRSSVIPKNLDIRYRVTGKTGRRKSKADWSSDNPDYNPNGRISDVSLKVKKKMIKVHPIMEAIS